MAVDFSLNEDLLAAVSRDEPDAERIHEILDQVRRAGIPLDLVALEFSFRKSMERIAERFRVSPTDLERLQSFEKVTAICPSLPFEVNLWGAQNVYFEVLKTWGEQFQHRAEMGDPDARALAVRRGLAWRTPLRDH